MEEEKEKLNILDSMDTCARERWFLLNLKAKFAGKSFFILFNVVFTFVLLDGQYLASRLSKSISQESSKLKQRGTIPSLALKE